MEIRIMRAVSVLVDNDKFVVHDDIHPYHRVFINIINLISACLLYIILSIALLVEESIAHLIFQKSHDANHTPGTFNF